MTYWTLDPYRGWQPYCDWQPILTYRIVGDTEGLLYGDKKRRVVEKFDEEGRLIERITEDV